MIPLHHATPVAIYGAVSSLYLGRTPNALLYTSASEARQPQKGEMGRRRSAEE